MPLISDYLDRKFVLQQTTAQRDWLVALQKRLKRKDKTALAELKKRKIKPDQIAQAIVALNASLKVLAKDKQHPSGSAFIPRDPLTCLIQTAMTQTAITEGLARNATTGSASVVRSVRAGAAASKKKRKTAAGGLNTSAPLRLKLRPGAKPTKAQLRAAFVEGLPWNNGDIHYGLDGFTAKFGALFTGRHDFNKRPASVATSTKPLRLFVFGDWGTGLPLAAAVTERVGEQLAGGGAGRQQHVIHLGDVYYVGTEDEYVERMIPFWPVAVADKKRIGSWSLNGNHDMYAGGFGYFDTLLTEERFREWHSDDKGNPSSFFLIEDPHWQVFGLDTSWNLPSLGSVVFGKPTKDDYGGQNGVLTDEQVSWMKKVRNPAKGCILLTHHQPASSRTSEKQHAKEAIASLRAAGLYDQIDAWIWGHEHRGVVFKPKADRRHKVLKEAPGFCACLGHGGVPVTKKNFEAENRIADVLWDEDRLDSEAPVYEDERVVPFGFASIETNENAFDFNVFDHTGSPRFACSVARGGEMTVKMSSWKNHK